MGKRLNRLSALTVARLCAEGRYNDGYGLYLQVREGGAKSWIYRYTLNGRTRDMGLGSAHLIGLSEARTMAERTRLERVAGIDPIEARKKRQHDARVNEQNSITFAQCARLYFDAHSAAWRNEKYKKQWLPTLRRHTDEAFGNTPVKSIDLTLVMKAIDPIWRQKSETATRMRERIEQVLDFATVRGHRDGENPARWKGRLENLLPRPSKVRRVQHHPAIHFNDIPDFVCLLRSRDGVSAAALEFLILTATRTGEVTGARWDEIDFAAAAWNIPAERMKMAKDHRVPLAAPSIRILHAMRTVQHDGFIFPSGRPGHQLSNMVFLALLRRMKRTDITPHGFRSTFRDWVAECTQHSRDVAEMALAHSVSNSVEAAYRRGNLFEKRKTLMKDWADYCEASSECRISAFRKVG